MSSSSSANKEGHIGKKATGYSINKIVSSFNPEKHEAILAKTKEAIKALCSESKKKGFISDLNNKKLIKDADSYFLKIPGVDKSIKDRKSRTEEFDKYYAKNPPPK
jgi:hypothetical protein